MLLLGLALAACKEEQGVEVKDLSFTGNKAVTTAQLKSVLATAESPMLPWGHRSATSPASSSRPTSSGSSPSTATAAIRTRGCDLVRCQLSSDQNSVRLKINIEEGEPIRVERVEILGLRADSRSPSPRARITAAAQGRRAARSRAGASQPRSGARRAQGPRLPEPGGRTVARRQGSRIGRGSSPTAPIPGRSRTLARSRSWARRVSTSGSSAAS